MLSTLIFQKPSARASYVLVWLLAGDPVYFDLTRSRFHVPTIGLVCPTASPETAKVKTRTDTVVKNSLMGHLFLKFIYSRFILLVVWEAARLLQADADSGLG